MDDGYKYKYKTIYLERMLKNIKIIMKNIMFKQ